MSPSAVTRSSAITLLISMAFVGPHARGFTIDRTNNITSSTDAQSTDLSSDESFKLQVKDDLKRLNDIQNSKEDNSNKTVNNNIKMNITKETLEVKSINNLNVQHKQTSTEIITTTENTKVPTISSDTVEVFDSVEDIAEFKRNKSIAVSSVKAKELEIEHKVIALGKNIELTTQSLSETTVLSETPTVSDQIDTEMESREDQSTKKAISLSDNDTMETIISNVSKTATETIEMSTSTMVSIVEGVDNTTSENLTTDLSQPISEDFVSVTTSIEGAGETTEISSTYTESNTFETTTDFSSKISEPSWRKYTTIERKRVTSAEDTSQAPKTKDETMRAETSNTHANFEIAIDVTPNPSSEKLRGEKKQAISSEMMSDESGKTTVAIKSTILTPNTVQDPDAKRIEIVQTQRAGYLDYSERASSTVSTTVSIDRENETQFVTTGDDNETLETETPDLKKVSGSESQSQLAEDAIQEELMKEEALKNHQESLLRYRDDKTASVDVRSGIRADESLSVQPINQERTKTTLYTISPNYKPMKKIEVQPAKQFVRDPDDNSWRNESISSLGIVFKPKNSSISFKEVLKNKTQIELNNLQEKDAKNDIPELRLRLEKIAEVRKTKKMKMNKDGEEVYTDYEEDKSAESTSTPPPESVSSVLESAELSKVTSSTPANNEMNPEDITSPMSLTQLEANKAKISHAIFKSLGLDSLDYLTTAKPKKFFNIAEYYDTTDEYDADYLTMSKLDLKKFTVPPVRTSPTKETHHIEPLLNRPMKPYSPERKPTIQYFPPRKPQKVNVNNADKNFERKVNLFKDRPKIEPLPPFETVPPLPIATEKPAHEMRPEVLPDMAYMSPHSRPDMRPGISPDIGPDRPDFQVVNPPYERPDISSMRPTVKPTDLTMYTPADLSRNYYLTNAPRPTEPHDAYVIHEGNLNRGSYVIKHYKDLLNAAAAKGADDDRRDYNPLTESPREGTVSDIIRDTPKGADYDYDVQFRKEVLNRFVDNFNQNSERFKVDFPIMYNSSIVHRPADEHGRVMASSRAFLKRLYNSEGTATRSNAPPKKPCEPHCDMTVELSPAYELHYYVPEQEEMEPRSPTPSTSPYRYSL